jgi:hypothetical protein
MLGDTLDVFEILPATGATWGDLDVQRLREYFQTMTPRAASPEAGLTDLDQALKLQPFSAEAYKNRGLVYRNKGAAPAPSTVCGLHRRDVFCICRVDQAVVLSRAWRKCGTALTFPRT